MNILHITNDFSGSLVYKNLVTQLDDLGLNQIVYTPIRSKDLINKNNIDFKQVNSKIIYSNILNKTTDRLLYHNKIKKIFNDIEKKINIDEIDIVHAHTCFSDGGVAYEIYKKYKIPYLIAIRNTDLNLFFKYLFYLKGYGVDILINSSKIIFISSIYSNRFKQINYYKKIHSLINDKIEIIPNGIDSFWINNLKKRKTIPNNPIELLYIGNFSSNKNLLRLIKAVNFLNKETYICNLKVIGSKGSQEKRILNEIKKEKHFTYLGEIRDKDKIQEIFGNTDVFTMPSKTETFGLVYIEALSQGIPVLYTINEGIYNLYENIGEPVNPYDVHDIINGIKKIMLSYNKYNFNPKSIIQNHDWTLISKKYYMIYSSIIYKSNNL